MTTETLKVVEDAGAYRIQRKTPAATYVSNMAYEKPEQAQEVAERRAAYTGAMVIGFPDLSDAELGQILTHTPAFEAKADQDAYNWGWTAWGLGLCSDHLEGIALQGWLDAEDAYAEERAAERQMLGQLVNWY